MEILGNKLKKLIPEIIIKANEILNAWEQDDDEFSDDYGSGGICDEIAGMISSIISNADIDVIEGGQEGDDHAYVVAYDDNEAYEIDIPPNVYEVGGGYSWNKRKDVIITEDDILINKIPRSWLELVD